MHLTLSAPGPAIFQVGLKFVSPSGGCETVRDGWLSILESKRHWSFRPRIGLLYYLSRSALVHRIARDLGFPVTGTLGVLDEAARRHLISLPTAMANLKKTSFRKVHS